MLDKLYFPGLNALRFFAAFSVIFGHIEQSKAWFGLPPFSLDWAIMNGDDAVTLFFALSGFLITYLLLVEQRRTCTIHVGKFYARRILRIWPLYYLLVFVGFALLPLLPLEGYRGPNHPRAPEALLGNLLFVPNALPYLGIYVVGITHLWTIGVEEQFYLIWPLLLRRFARCLPRVLLAIIALKMIVLVMPRPAELHQVLLFLTRFRIENMAVGGLGAYVLFTEHRTLRLVVHPVVEKVVLAAVIANVVFVPGNETPAANLALSALYTLFILNLVSNPRSTAKLDHSVLNRLGQLSYGLYMFHLPVIYVVIVALHNSGDFVIYTVVMALTVGLAIISYRCFEQPFLALKKRFTVVESSSLDIPEGASQAPSFGINMPRP